MDEGSTAWLHDIYEYIAQDDPNAATRLVRGIYRKAQTLSDFPEIGQRYESLPGREIRILQYGHYRIVYLIRRNESVDILGVFHGAMDIDRYLT